MPSAHVDGFQRDFIALHKRHRENITILDPGFNMQRHHLFVRYTGPDTNVTSNGVIFTRFDHLNKTAILDAVRSQVTFFRNLRRNFEWKFLDYDLPTDLPELLDAEGFVKNRVESVMALEAKAAGPVTEIPGVRIEEINQVAGFQAIKTVEEAVWGGDASSLVSSLQREKAASPDVLRIFVAYADTQAVACAWLRMDRCFGLLLGGSTLPDWRGKGIYRQLVYKRMKIASEKNLRFVATDAGSMSAPILEKIGFAKVAEVMRFHSLVSNTSRTAAH